MRYLGGKSRLGKKIAGVILSATQRRDEYIEPFLGGAGVLVHMAPHFATVRASDVHEDLILMWQTVQCGWVPPEHVSEDEYTLLRHAKPSALRGFVGFGCSFGAKWFAGYARGINNKGTWRNYAAESSRAVAIASSALARATITRASALNVFPSSSAVVYCDPPYRETTGYSHVFDHDAFFRRATEWSRAGADVFVSEYQAPSDWTQIWEHAHRNSVAIGKTKQTTERLFVHESRVPHLVLG